MNWAALVASHSNLFSLSQTDLRATSISGGDINQAYLLEVGKHQFFIKINRAELLTMFEAERRGLDEIRSCKAIRVPEVFATGTEDDEAYIVMEYIEMAGRADPKRFATQLATMHNFTQPRFGFDCDNTIGSSAQVNSHCGDWVEFWQQRRLGFQLELGARNGFDSKLLDDGARLNELLDIFFKDYQPKPSLLHGDLWPGNWGTDAGGNPVIYDPACYYGDHETDLAMMELFGNPGEHFFSVYGEMFPIDDDYAIRRDLYNLYHILNHANLFGGGYASQATSMMKKLLAQL